MITQQQLQQTVIDHLPAITDALDDAIQYRRAEGNQCHYTSCDIDPADEFCTKHAVDHAKADAYQNLLAMLREHLNDTLSAAPAAATTARPAEHHVDDARRRPR